MKRESTSFILEKIILPYFEIENVEIELIKFRS